MNLHSLDGNPRQFEHQSHKIEFVNVVEFGQNAIETGNLIVDNCPVYLRFGYFRRQHRFVNKPVFHNELMILPVFRPSGWSYNPFLFDIKCFRLCVVDLVNKKADFICKPHDILIPFDIKNNEIVCFLDVQNTKKAFFVL